MGINLSAGGAVALGVIVGLLSTSIQSVGLTLQRKSHLLEEEKEEQDPEYYERRPPYRRRRWQIGMSMFLFANLVGSSIQITTLPLPVLSTLQASGLVFNTACATIILHEPFTKYSFIGTLLVAGGAVLIAIYGSLTEPSHNLIQLLILLGRPHFLVWLFATLFVAFLIILGMWFLGRIHPRPSMRIRLVRGMSYGAISGILSAHCLLVAKSSVELLVRTIADHSNQFDRWQSWMILLGLVILALAQLYYLHRGLKLCSTSVLYPFVFCVYNIIAILDGLIYFDQTARITVKEALLIALGTVILLAGVFALSWRLDDKPSQPTRDQLEASETAKWLQQRIPTPQSALEPGFGLLHATSSTDSVEQSPYLRPADDEEALSHARHLRANASETTPLLRTSTTPIWQENITSRKRERPRLSTRRLTTSITGHEDVSEIWDELNDRVGEDRKVSFANLDSPASSRSFGRAKGRRRAETMPSRRRASTGQNPLANMPWLQWRSLGQSLGQLRRKSGQNHDDEGHPAPTSEPDETDGEDQAPSAAGPSERGRIDRSRRTEGDSGWFRLRWWKRRRRERSEPGEGDGVDAIDQHDTT